MSAKKISLNKKIVGLGLLSIGLCSCASPDQITLLERRVNTLAMENTQIKDELKSMKGQSIRADIDNIQKNQAKIDNRLNEINAEMLRVSGTMEQVSHNYSKDRSRLDKLELNVGGTASQDTTQTIDEPDVTTQKNTKLTTTADIKEPHQNIPLDYYKNGIELFKQKNFKEAKNNFESYAKENPQGKYLSNSFFWIGECEYNMGKFEEAILSYQTVIEKYPNSEKNSGSLLKQGISFQKIGDNKSAKAVFDKLMKHYPNSPQAAIAKDYMKKL
jgi:tol-pal system protein YbgF